jgi:hypothetical protein
VAAQGFQATAGMARGTAMWIGDWLVATGRHAEVIIREKFKLIKKEDHPIPPLL